VSRRLGLRRRLATWIDPSSTRPDRATNGVVAAAPTEELPQVPARTADDDLWIRVARQFALRILAASYRMSADLGEAASTEQDADRLQRLYRLDHVNTGVRRQAENLQVLSGARVEDAGRQVTTLLDVVRAAAAAVDDYPRIRIARVTGLAVVEYAADDVIRILTEVFDNAARFSPPSAAVMVATHLTELGHILVRVEDEGIGVDPAQLPRLNASLAGELPLTFDQDNPATRVGLMVVQRLAVPLRVRVTLVPRQPGGTTASVLIPAALLCEVPLDTEVPQEMAAPVEPAMPMARSAPAATAVESGQSSVGGAVGPRSGVTLPPGPDPGRRLRPVTTIVPRRATADPPPIIEAIPIAALPSRTPTRVPPPLSHHDAVPPLASGRMPAPAGAVLTASTFSDEVGDFADGIAHARADADERPDPDTRPDHTASDHTASDHTAPDHTAPDHTAPDHTAPDRAASDHTAPDRAASDHTAPDRAAPDLQLLETEGSGQ
jgi:hypothetical protein